MCNEDIHPHEARARFGIGQYFLEYAAFPSSARYPDLKPLRLVHEMMHGVSNRMTGGGTARCLQSPEGRGMGEGWGDALAKYALRNYSNHKLTVGTR